MRPPGFGRRHVIDRVRHGQHLIAVVYQPARYLRSERRVRPWAQWRLWRAAMPRELAHRVAHYFGGKRAIPPWRRRWFNAAAAARRGRRRLRYGYARRRELGIEAAHGGRLILLADCRRLCEARREELL